MDNKKDNKFIKLCLKYKIAIIVGLALGLILALYPSDYTDKVVTLNKEIETLDKSLKEKQASIKLDVEVKVVEIDTKITESSKKKAELTTKRNEVKKVYDAKKAAEEKAEQERLAAEAKERADKLAAEKKAEEEKRKGKWILEGQGYNVWEAYFTPGTYKITVNHKGNQYGSGNVIVYAGTKENQNQIVVMNNIGVGDFAGTFKVSSSGYYTLTFKTGGAFTFEYAPL